MALGNFIQDTHYFFYQNWMSIIEVRESWVLFEMPLYILL